MVSKVNNYLSNSVSSVLSYLGENPKTKFSHRFLQHESNRISFSEKVSKAVTFTSLALGIFGAVGILGSSHFILGALFAIAAVGFFFNYCYSLAQDKLNAIMSKGDNIPEEGAPQEMEADKSPSEIDS